MFDASSLAVFVEVARQSSFVRAARRLGVPTTTISRKVANLETSLGVRLLARTTRSVGLTEAGRTYLARVGPIVEAIEQANRSVTMLQEEVVGRLRITAPRMIGTRLVADWVLAYQREYPRVEVSLLLDSQLLNLPETGTDIAFRIGVLRDSDLVARHLLRFERRIVATPEFLATHGRVAAPSELADVDAVLVAGSNEPIAWQLQSESGERARFEPRGRLRVNDLDVALGAVLAHAGMALLPDIMVDDALQRGILLEVLAGWRGHPTDLNLVYATKYLVTSAQSTFVRFVVDRCGETRRGN